MCNIRNFELSLWNIRGWRADTRNGQVPRPAIIRVIRAEDTIKRGV